MIRVVCEMPEVDVLGIVTADEQVQQPVAIVIEPDGGVGVDPGRQPGLLAHAGEAVALVVMEELRASPLDEEQVFVSVIIVIAPNCAGRDSGARLIDVRNAEFAGHIFESAVAQVAVQAFLLPMALLTT